MISGASATLSAVNMLATFNHFPSMAACARPDWPLDFSDKVQTFLPFDLRCHELSRSRCPSTRPKKEVDDAVDHGRFPVGPPHQVVTFELADSLDDHLEPAPEHVARAP